MYSWAIWRVSYLDNWVSGPSPGRTFRSLSNPWFRRSIRRLSLALAASLRFFITDSGISDEESHFLVLFELTMGIFGSSSSKLSSLRAFLLFSRCLLLKSTGKWSLWRYGGEGGREMVTFGTVVDTFLCRHVFPITGGRRVKALLKSFWMLVVFKPKLYHFNYKPDISCISIEFPW